MKFEEMINTIQLGDCYELIKNIPDKSIDLIIIDPPYEYTTGVGGGAFGNKNRDYHEQYMKVSTNENEIMGIRHKKYLIEGVQFHPEAILSEQGHDILRNFIKEARERVEM